MVKNKNLIGISSKSCGGKDTVAKIIQYFITLNNYPDFNIDLYDILKYWQKNGFDISGDIITRRSGYEVRRFADKLKQIVSLLTGISREDLEKEEIKSSFLPQEWNTFNIQQNFEGTLEDYKELMSNPNNKSFDIVGIPTKNIGVLRWTYYELIHQISVRELLQTLGTRCLRNVHKNIHVNALFADYRPLTSSRAVLLDFSDNLKELDASESIPGECPKWIIPDLRFKNEFQAIQNRGGLTIRIERDYDKKNPKFNHQSETDLDDYREKFDYIIDNNDFIKILAKQVKTILQLEGII